MNTTKVFYVILIVTILQLVSTLSPILPIKIPLLLDTAKADPGDNDNFFVNATPRPGVIYEPPSINYTKAWQVLASKARWILEGNNGGGWVNLTNRLVIHLRAPEDHPDQRKLTLNFTTPAAGDYRLTVLIDYPIVGETVDHTNHTITLQYNAHGNDFYYVFNYSDLAAIEGLILTYGELDGKFWFRIQKNEIVGGKFISLDPMYVIHAGGGFTNPSKSNVNIISRSTNGTIYVVHSFNNHIKLYISRDNGLTWTGRQATVNGSGNWYYPSMAIDSNDVCHIVFQKYITVIFFPTYAFNDGWLYYMRYFQSNNSFSSVVNISSATKRYCNPSIAVDGHDRVHVLAGSNDTISPYYYSVSYKMLNGSWSADVDIARQTRWIKEYYPTLALDSNNNVHVVWMNQSRLVNPWSTDTTIYPSNILYRVKYASNNTWNSKIINVSYPKPFHVQSVFQYVYKYPRNNSIPSIIVNDTAISVVWNVRTYLTSQAHQIQFSTSLNGKTWTIPVNLTSVNHDRFNNQTNASISYSADNKLHISFMGEVNATGSHNRLRVINYSGGWEQVTNYSYSLDQLSSYLSNISNNLMHAYYPKFGTTQTNIPSVGYCGTFSNGSFLYFYASSDISYQQLIPVITLNYPPVANGSHWVSMRPTIKIRVLDGNTVQLITRVYENSTGSWQRMMYNITIGNDIVLNFNFTNASTPLTKYFFMVSAIDDDANNVTEWFWFELGENASSSPIITLTSPLNNTIDVCPCCGSFCFTISQANGKTMNVTIYSGTSINTTYYNIGNGTYCFCFYELNISRYNWIYTWYVFAVNYDNASINTTSPVYTFTTVPNPLACVVNATGGGATGSSGYGYMLPSALGVVGMIGLIGIVGLVKRKVKRRIE